ncbi:MAG: hypothetical protein ABIP57_11995 [Jatrophihabitantaceae bacterium]
MPSTNPTLHDEHRDLLTAVTELATPVLAEADAGRWPAGASPAVTTTAVQDAL